MIYIGKNITFDIYLLKSEIDIQDYMLLFEDTDPSDVTQVGFVIKPLDVGEDDPSLFGDSWLFQTSTTSEASVIGTRSFFYTVYDLYGNTDFSSNSFTFDVCLEPTKPILTSPVYNEGEGELIFEIGQ